MVEKKCPTCVVCGFQRPTVDKKGACYFCVEKEKAEQLAYEKGLVQGRKNVANSLIRQIEFLKGSPRRNNLLFLEKFCEGIK